MAAIPAFGKLAALSRERYGKRSCVVGQGELKKTQFDHLFSVNHSFANARAKINRLNRRTWCTTKRPERLADHIDVYIDVLCDRLERGRKNERYSDVLG